MSVTASDGVVEIPKTVGGRLRAAREAQGLSLDDIGRQTRVPVRHLVQIEEGRLQGLPAAPYSAGFVKSYARAVSLDPVPLSHAFRADFDTANRDAPRVAYEPYEPADPVRLPPRLLAIVAVAIALALVAGYAMWRSGPGEGPDARARLAAAGDDSAGPRPVARQAAAPPGPVVPVPAGRAVQLTALDDVWLQVSDRATKARLFSGVLARGKVFAVPATAGDPIVKTGRPEAVAVAIGGRPVAPLGAPGRTIADVSLRAPSLLARGASLPPVVIAPAADMSPAFRAAETIAPVHP